MIDSSIMCDITRLREMCRDYSETSARVSKSLILLKHELRSLRQQDVMLLKQLVSINDIISSIKVNQKSGSPATLPRSASFTSHKTPFQSSRTLSYTMSLRQPLNDLTNPVRFIDGAKRAVGAAGSPHLRQSPVLVEGTPRMRESPGLIEGTPHLKQSPVLLQGMPQKANANMFKEPIASRGVTVCSVNLRNDDNERYAYLTDQTPANYFDEPMLRHAWVLRSSTTSIDTLQSQADSVYGSGSDLRMSCDSLHAIEYDPSVTLPSEIDVTEVIIV